MSPYRHKYSNLVSLQTLPVMLFWFGKNNRADCKNTKMDKMPIEKS